MLSKTETILYKNVNTQKVHKLWFQTFKKLMQMNIIQFIYKKSQVQYSFKISRFEREREILGSM